MPTKLFITDERMLLVIQWAVQTNVAPSERAFLKMIKFPPTNISNARRGLQSFTKEHILRACQLTGTSADYIFGFTNIRAKRPSRKTIEVFREAVAAVEIELKNGSRQNR